MGGFTIVAITIFVIWLVAKLTEVRSEDAEKRTAWHQFKARFFLGRISSVLRVIYLLLTSILLLGLIFLGTVKFLLSNNVSETERAIKQFKSSTKESIKASELLGNGWGRLCVVGDYAEVGDLEKALLRNLNIREQLLWLRYANENDWLVVAYEKNGRITKIEMISDGDYQRGCHDYERLYLRKEVRAGLVTVVFGVN